jgi:photosystem II stability/assembly factor-like uncharacterized protein
VSKIREIKKKEGNMEPAIFLATTGKGIARARQNGNGEWSLDFPHQGTEVTCLAGDPSNNNIIYAGTQDEGLLRSEDSGTTWHPAGLAGQTIKALAVSPHDPRVIYAGTRLAYMFVTQDGGETWNELDGFRRIPGRWWWFSPADPSFKAYVQNITISPDDPSVLLAGIELGGVVRSHDGGLTWSRHRKGALRDNHSLTFHGRDGDWVYQAGGSGGGASFSQDGGVTWRKNKQGLAKNYGVACTADPEKPEVWYVSVAPGPGKAYGKQAEAYLYRTTGGEPWQPIGWGRHPLSSMPIVLLTHPSKSGLLYAGLTNGEVWHSNDYGDTWDKLSFNFTGIWRSLIVLESGK